MLFLWAIHLWEGFSLVWVMVRPFFQLIIPDSSEILVLGSGALGFGSDFANNQFYNFGHNSYSCWIRKISFLKWELNRKILHVLSYLLASSKKKNLKISTNCTRFLKYSSIPLSEDFSVFKHREKQLLLIQGHVFYSGLSFEMEELWTHSLKNLLY